MDKEGIGTDATISEHIATIQNRDYAKKTPTNRFTPTNIGLALVETYMYLQYPLYKPYLRAHMERECTAISEGKVHFQEVIDSCIGEMSLMETPSVMSEEPRIGSVSRISADTLESSLFEDGRYRVNLSRDGRYIRFTRDVTGSAVAEKGRMRLPMLGRYVEFRSESELPAYGEDNEFRVLLDR